MASFMKRGDYQWQARVRAKGYPTQTRTFETKKEAMAWAAVIESEMARGMFVDRTEAESTTFGELLDRYAREISPTKRGSKKELQKINQMRGWPLAGRIVAGIHGKDIAKLRDERLKDVSAASVNREFNLLGHVFTVAIREWGFNLPANPIQMVSRPKVKASSFRNRRLEGDEENRLLAACADDSNPYLKPMVQVAIETAMRRGELLSLTWDRVALNDCVASLPITKNGTPRDVPLSKKAVAVLSGLPRSIDGRVFPFTSDNAVSMTFRRACRRAGIEDLRFHDLRHEATSRIAERVTDVHTLAKITGHKSLQMLQRYYHPRAKDLARMLD